MKLFQLLGFCFLVGSAVAVDSSEEDVIENGASGNADEANFVVLQNSEEALKVEPLDESIGTRGSLGEEPAMAGREEQGDAFQGDIKLTAEQRQQMLDTSIVESRTGLLGTNYRWPKNTAGHVIVPYIIDRSVSGQSSKIKEAMRNIERVSCVRFKERKTQKDYVRIKSHQFSCQSDLGRLQDGEQTIELADGCFGIGTLMHEMIHTLGYTHMHNHAKRDQFVKIHWDRILREDFVQFEKVNVREYGNFDTPYDFQSIMHYPLSSFPRDGLPMNTVTIEPLPKYKKFRSLIGTRETLSSGDIKRINNMYKCKK